MFNLEGCGKNLGVAEEIQKELAVEVADADGFGHTLAHKLLHGCPGFLDGGVAGNNILAIISEAWRVALRGVDIFQGYWEVDDV